MPGEVTPGKAEAVAFVGVLNDYIIFPLIALLTSVALMIFVYGCFEYVLNAENPAARDTGRKHIMWGIIGLLVIVSAYAILSVALNSFGLLETLTCAEDPNCGVVMPNP